MNTFQKTAALVAALAAPQLLSAQAAAPAPAPVASAPAYPAIADFAAAVRSSNAYQAAARAIQTQYKAQIDAYNARSQPLQAELQRSAQEIRTLQQANTPEATINPRIQAFQARQQAIQTELAPLAAPFERPLAYAEEQITAKLDQATRNAMTAKRVNILLRPEGVAFALPTSNITADIAQQLNALVPTVSTAVPANWQPGGQGGAAPAAAAPAATPRRNQGR
ncbi:OmpH family outer membrane protein [Sphingomonas sp.]|jgi:Skp family chaperone for outer membrane proteins|uniref:OmpH family outer membrane protein n=1 Tax=Sphingomonas sp. TaxID=28214 RepID=UPI002ED8BE4E